MTLPRISTRSIPAILAIVAADCMVYRSFSVRPAAIANEMSQLTLATLAMANVLAVMLTLLVRDGVRARRFGVGFVFGGLVGLGTTFKCLSAFLSTFESTLTPTLFGHWLMASPIRQAVGFFGVLVVLPFIFQVSLGLMGGLISRKIIRATPVDSPARRRPWLVVATSLVILLALPGLAVEATFHWKAEPPIARRVPGLKAVVDYHGFDSILPKGSKLRGLEGVKIRVERDDEAPVIELQATQIQGSRKTSEVQVRDFRRVSVTLLDGERAGETLGMPYSFLTPLR